MLKSILTVLVLLLFVAGINVRAQERLTYEQVYDFGHVGVDYKVFHDFWIHNPGDRPIKITKVDNNCDCTGVSVADSTIDPNDSVAVAVSFETKNFYGPTNKSLKVYTNHPQQPEIQLFYLSIIGQWYDGIRPNPHSLFFLPGQTSKVVKIPNPVFDKLKFVGWSSAHPCVKLETIEDTARKGETIELKVELSGGQTPHAMRSSLTIELAEQGSDHSIFLTLPIKVAQ